MTIGGKNPFRKKIISHITSVAWSENDTKRTYESERETKFGKEEKELNSKEKQLSPSEKIVAFGINYTHGLYFHSPVTRENTVPPTYVISIVKI